jgi:hypothetical protein
LLVARARLDKATRADPTTILPAVVVVAVLAVLVARLCQPVLTTVHAATAVPASATLCEQALRNATQVAAAVRVSLAWAAAVPLMVAVLVVAATVPVALPIQAAVAAVAVDRDALA